MGSNFSKYLLWKKVSHAGFQRHEGDWIFIFEGTIPLTILDEFICV